MKADVAVVGGGPAGAVLATLLARRGRHVVLFERSPAYRWRACGVFTSPASVAALEAVGLARDTIGGLARPIPAMRVETDRGTSFRLAYGDDGSLTHPAVGFDRSTLDPALLALAQADGADVRLGETVRSVDPGQVLAQGSGGEVRVDARVVVGADGIRSVVARSFGVGRPVWLGSRVGLTFHVAEPSPAVARDARMILFRDGYVGLAPVPGGRVNVGIVLGRSWARTLRENGAEATVREVLAGVPAAADDPIDWGAPDRCDAIEGVAPLGHRVTRRHGPGWLLVGDAAGFLDPFTGEGLHRALVSASLADAAIDGHLRRDAGALAAYDLAMDVRFRSKDVVSLLVQAFLARSAIFEYAARRLSARERVRETMGLVMGDLVPASRALDPRFVTALLWP
ncbi:MAG TPA: NAD(P)/FAD-dependent oxidoreductase [Candidatus Limnocylindrales bacterium]|nr:NAD(P)/FAD-dependent oxidoreductase [Candidatus Limnocylindrales bacterium]